jgi:uncharacterized protein
MTPETDWGEGELMNKFTHRNKTSVRFVGISAIRISFIVLSTAILLSSHPLFASGQKNGQTLDQCSIALVTKQKLAGVRICDVETVRSLARQGHIYEQNQMGIVSMLAIGPGYDSTEAIHWFERAAEKGYPSAQVNLAAMYINGWGTAPNYGVALRWLLEAANHGCPRAFYNLGLLYQQGLGVRKNPAEALRYFQLGAEGGDSDAQTNLGYMYDQGIGTTQNMSIAAEWYRKAAESGNAFAEYNLADLYLRGQGIAQNDKKAFSLFQQAAAQGETGACIKLGYMYANGRGTEKDLVTAYRWIMAAAIAGDDRGRDLIQAIEPLLSPAQHAQAKMEARKLKTEEPADIVARMLRP